MPSVLGVLFATLGALCLFIGLGMLLFIWPIGLVLLLFSFVFFFLVVAITRTPNFAAVYASQSGQRTQRYGVGSSRGGFQRSTTMGQYQNAFQSQGSGARRSGMGGFNQAKAQNGKGFSWIMLIVGFAFFVLGLSFGSITFLIYGIIFLYAGVKVLTRPLTGSFSYGQTQMNAVPTLAAGSQNDGFD